MHPPAPDHGAIPSGRGYTQQYKRLLLWYTKGFRPRLFPARRTDCACLLRISLCHGFPGKGTACYSLPRCVRYAFRRGRLCPLLPACLKPPRNEAAARCLLRRTSVPHETVKAHPAPLRAPVRQPPLPEPAAEHRGRMYPDLPAQLRPLSCFPPH